MPTVREIARLQGLDDDFVFYGSKDLQYLSVLNAVPPAVSKKIAETIMRSIRNSAIVRFTNIQPSSSRKRVRINDPETEAETTHYWELPEKLSSLNWGRQGVESASCCYGGQLNWINCKNRA
jgi:hypothetical protein